MKLLGLVGGTSYHSTIVYYQTINQRVGEHIGAHANPPLIIHSLNIELMRSQDINRINSTYLETAQKLAKAGTQAIIICANTPHMAYDYVQPKIDIPILHIADAIGNNAKKNGLKRLGLLGNKPTMTGGFIPEILHRNYGIDTIIPEEHCLSQAHHYVSKELTQGIFSPSAKEFFLNQMNLLEKRGAEGIILGCTELPLLIDSEDFHLPLLSTTDLHIQMAVDFILNE